MPGICVPWRILPSGYYPPHVKPAMPQISCPIMPSVLCLDLISRSKEIEPKLSTIVPRPGISLYLTRVHPKKSCSDIIGRWDCELLHVGMGVYGLDASWERVPERIARPRTWKSYCLFFTLMKDACLEPGAWYISLRAERQKGKERKR